MKKSIDVEKLVQWALRDELPKGQAVAASAWQIVEQYVALGTRVQTGGYQGDGLGFSPGAPHEDALIVADAVRALATEWKFATSYDARQAFGAFLPIAGDAVSSLMMARFDPRSLVISMGMQGKRPSWNFEQPTPHQMFVLALNAAGAVRERPLVHGVDADGAIVSLLPNRGRAVARDGLYSYASAPRSPLDWRDPAMLHIGEARAEYIAWHRALVDLARDLRGRLADFEVTMPAIAALPWITGQTPASRVLAGRDLVGDDAAGLPLSPKRGSMLRPVESPIEIETRAAYNSASRNKRRKAVAAVA